MNLQHRFDFAVADGAIHVRRDVAFVIKADVPWQLMDLRPLHGFLLVPVFGENLDFRAVELSFGVAFHAHRQWWGAGGGRVRDRDVTLRAGEPHLGNVGGVGELDRLNLPLRSHAIMKAQAKDQEAG